MCRRDVRLSISHKFFVLWKRAENGKFMSKIIINHLIQEENWLLIAVCKAQLLFFHLWSNLTSKYFSKKITWELLLKDPCYQSGSSLFQFIPLFNRCAKIVSLPKSHQRFVFRVNLYLSTNTLFQDMLRNKMQGVNFSHGLFTK